jgi:hypothetical protein
MSTDNKAPVQEPYGYWWIPDGSVSGLKPEMSPNTGPHPNFTVIPLYTTPPAPAVPDAITDNSESPDYREGWNDCRQAMMEMMK